MAKKSSGLNKQRLRDRLSNAISKAKQNDSHLAYSDEEELAESSFTDKKSKSSTKRKSKARGNDQAKARGNDQALAYDSDTEPKHKKIYLKNPNYNSSDETDVSSKEEESDDDRSLDVDDQDSASQPNINEKTSGGRNSASNALSRPANNGKNTCDESMNLSWESISTFLNEKLAEKTMG